MATERVRPSRSAAWHACRDLNGSCSCEGTDRACEAMSAAMRAANNDPAKAVREMRRRMEESRIWGMEKDHSDD